MSEENFASFREETNPASISDDHFMVGYTTAVDNGECRYKRSTHFSWLRLKFSAMATAIRGDLGLSNVNNTSDANKPISAATQAALDGKANMAHAHAIADVSGLQTVLDGKAPIGHSHDSAYDALGSSAAVQSNLTSHTGNTNNPHGVTKEQVGLGNIPNVDATNRQNHTGTQLASTITDFASTVLVTVLAGLSIATGTAITADDSILSALGKLQKQITDLTTSLSGYASLSNSNTWTAAQAIPVPLVFVSDESTTFALAYANKRIVFNSTTGYADCGIPANAPVAFPVGSTLTVINEVSDSGDLVIYWGATVYVNGSNNGDYSLTTHQSLIFLQIATNQWITL